MKKLISIDNLAEGMFLEADVVIEEREREGMIPRGQSIKLFAIFDCRHMVTPGFWEQTMIHFFKEEKDQDILRGPRRTVAPDWSYHGVDRHR